MPATAPAPSPIPAKFKPTPAAREKPLSMPNGCKIKIIENPYISISNMKAAVMKN